MTDAPSWICVGVRVTVECTECASPIPVNGIVPSVLCHACQATVTLDGATSWGAITTYAKGEPCSELHILLAGRPLNAFDCFLAIDVEPRRLQRRRRGVLLELDEGPARCSECREALDGATLVETAGAAETPHVFCPSCGKSVSLRIAGDVEHSIHPTIAAVVSETAVRGDLAEPTETVLFSCLGCGAPLKIGAAAQRICACDFCHASNYIPDALWLRLHPAQRKRPFYFLLRADLSAIGAARQRVLPQ